MKIASKNPSFSQLFKSNNLVFAFFGVEYFVQNPFFGMKRGFLAYKTFTGAICSAKVATVVRTVATVTGTVATFSSTVAIFTGTVAIFSQRQQPLSERLLPLPERLLPLSERLLYLSERLLPLPIGRDFFQSRPFSCGFFVVYNSKRNLNVSTPSAYSHK